MLGRCTSTIAVLSLLGVAAARPADAQEPVASSFEQLQMLARIGDTITVTDSNGRDQVGKVGVLSPSSLVLLSHGDRHDFGESDILAVRRKGHANLATGAKWGFGIGAGFGLIGGLAISGACHDCGALIPFATAIYGGLGAGIGVGLAASVSTDRIIYSPPHAKPGRVAVAPFATPQRRGVALSLAF
jgi:hypothetical protein